MWGRSSSGFTRPSRSGDADAFGGDAQMGCVAFLGEHGRGLLGGEEFGAVRLMLGGKFYGLDVSRVGLMGTKK